MLEYHDGPYTNSYASFTEIAGPAPEGPWAMYLADRDGYRYLCFDLDPKAGNAAHDAGRLSLWLDELNIAHVITASGPTGGRHVWISLAHSVDPALIREVADLAGTLLPSLDKAPLSNAKTGCVRPPGSPHRLGGASVVVRGRDTDLLNAATTVDDLAQLRSFLIEAGAELPAAPVSVIRGMAIDDAGHPYLVGRRREPSARIRVLLTEAPATDASTTQAAALAGLARARWRFHEVAALLEHSPALEHARTRPTAGGRAPIALDAAQRRLAADWRRAVYYVAANPIAGGNQDDDFQARARAVTAAVRAATDRADSMPGRWGLDAASRPSRAHRGRYSHRAVLRAVCLYLVQAAQPVVEVDTRRLAADTGYGREACRLALLALSTPDNEHDDESAWLIRIDAAEGPHGATYRLSNRFSTEAEAEKWAQAATRPSPTAGSDARAWWMTTLSNDLHPLAHDTFAAPHSLGRSAGRTFAALSPDVARTVDELAGISGIPATQLRRFLRRLHARGLVDRIPTGWARPAAPPLERVAVELGVDGYLEQRAARYELERARWAWWSAELVWMRRRHKKRRARRAPTGVALFAQNDRPDFPRYPRSPAGYDHAGALELIRDGILNPAAPIDVAA